MRTNVQRLLTVTAGPILSLGLALAVTTVFLQASGYNAASAYSVMLQYGARPASLVTTLDNAAPLYLSAMAGAVALRMGLFNIGVDGQYRLAALIGAVVAAQMPGPTAVRVGATVLVAMVIGALWALIPALLLVQRGVHEVITSILLNAVATTVVATLLANVFRSGSGLSTGTATIDEGGRLPSLWKFDGIAGGGAVSGFVAVAVLGGLLYYAFTRHSVLGYTMGAASISRSAAQSAGIDVRRRILLAMAISGAVAGMVGLPHVLDTAHAYNATMPTDLMFVGLAATLLGRAHPVGMAAAALTMAFIERCSQVLSVVNLPTEVGSIFLAVVLLSSVVAYWLVERGSERWARRRHARAARTPRSDVIVPTGAIS